jgi:hypothetical protein
MADAIDTWTSAAKSSNAPALIASAVIASSAPAR